MRVFKEEQRFTQTWLLIMLMAIVVFPTIKILQSFINKQVGLFYFLGIVSLIIAPCALILIFKLKTRIDENGIHYQFFPFHLKIKTILWKDIKLAKTRKYKPISEFGGWGLKGGHVFGKRSGIAINVKGNIGIQLVLKNNKKILIGTQKRVDANSVISRYFG